MRRSQQARVDSISLARAASPWDTTAKPSNSDMSSATGSIESIPAISPPPPRRIPVLLGALIVVSVAALFFSLYWNRFVGIRSGSGDYASGALILAGHLPYRDYFAATPPLNPFKSAIILTIFGNAPIVSRAFGALERLLLGLLLYLWLLRLFKPAHACIAAVVTIIASAGDIADPISSYNHDTIFLAMLSGFLASFVLDAERKFRSVVLLALASGVFASLSFLTKQTIGMAAITVVPFVVVLLTWKLDGLRKCCAWMAAFALGCVIPLCAFLLCLAHFGVLHKFLHMVFVEGPAAKASHPLDFFERDLDFFLSTKAAFILPLAALAAAWTSLNRSASGAGRLGRADAAARPGLSAVWKFSLIAMVGFVSILLALWVTNLPTQNKPSTLGVISPSALAAVFAVLCLLALLVEELYIWLRGRITRRQAQFALLAVVSFSIAFMLSLSFPLFEAMLIPGFGLIFAALLDGASEAFMPLLYGVAALLIFSQTCFKLVRPYGFTDILEPPVREAHAVSKLPIMHGFILPQSTVDFIDGTMAIIDAHSRPDDTIFTYPEMGIFYGLSGRMFPTQAGSHNVDVVDDKVAIAEAQRLLNARPAVIIYHPESEQSLLLEEKIWRHGKPIGQRAIIAAIQTLAKSYHLAATCYIPPNDQPILVYVRQ